MQQRRSLALLTLALLLAACSPPAERAAAYMEKAQRYFDEGDLTKARLEAQNAAQVEPKNARARYLLALIAEQQQQIQQMFGHLLVAVDSDPTNVEARLKLGTLYFAGQAWEQAAEEARVLMELAPEDPRVRLLQARVLIQRREQEAGLAEVDKTLELNPDYVDALILRAAADAIESIDKGLATIDAAVARLPAEESRPLRELRIVMLSQGRRVEDVEKGLVDLTRDFPEVDQYQFQLARFYTSQGRVDEADSLLRQVAALDPTDQESRIGYVQFLATQRDVDRAVGALQAFIAEAPETSDRLRLALGEIYEGTGRSADARAAYQGLADRSPKSKEGIQARGRLAALEIQASNLPGALAIIDRILVDVPDDESALLLRAGIRFIEERYDDAIADLRAVLRKNPNEDRALLIMAQAYVRKNDLVLAKDTYRRLLELKPDSADGLRELSVLYTANREFAEAEALLRRRLETAPDDVLASGRLVELLMAQDRTADAETEARRMTALQNQMGVGDFSLGRVLAQKQDYTAAAEAFRRSVAARAGDPLPLEGLVRSLLAAGKQQEAIQTLTAQLDQSGNQLFARYLLGGIYGAQGDQAKAVEYLEDVIQAKPDSIPAYISLAQVYGNDRQARIRVYERGLKAVPGNPQLGLLLGTEYEQLGDFEKALAVYEELVKVNPSFEPGVNNLAATLLDHRSDRASLERALRLARQLENTDNPAMLDTLGWAYYRNGQHNEAIRVLERVVGKAGQFAVFRYHLGMAYLAAGNDVAARQELEQALSRDDVRFEGIEDARAALARLKAAG